MNSEPDLFILDLKIKYGFIMTAWYHTGGALKVYQDLGLTLAWSDLAVYVKTKKRKGNKINA